MVYTEVIGQHDVKERLKQLAASGRMPHAIMLTGETGYGSLALAMATASQLVCQSPTPEGEACGQCPQCAMLKHWHHPDVHFTYPTVKLPSMSSEHKPTSGDFAKEWNETICTDGPYLSMDAWMTAMKATTQQAIITAAESDELSRKLALKSSQGGYKVSIIWQPERMNDESANKILKTLEEPPQQTVFILVSEKPELLLETIRSRVQKIEVPKISEQELANALVERRGLEEEVARKLARVADGNWLKAIEQLDPNSEPRMFLDLFMNLMRAVYKKDVRQMKQWSDTVGGPTFGREKQKRFIIYCMRMVRESFMSNFQDAELSYMTDEEEKFVKNFGRFINEANVLDINDLFELALRDISQNTTQKIVFFDTALRLTVLLLRK